MNVTRRDGKHILVVDMYDAFTANPDYQTAWMFDGLHPNDTRYARMAKVWYTTLGPLLH